MSTLVISSQTATDCRNAFLAPHRIVVCMIVILKEFIDFIFICQNSKPLLFWGDFSQIRCDWQPLIWQSKDSIYCSCDSSLGFYLCRSNTIRNNYRYNCRGGTNLLQLAEEQFSYLHIEEYMGCVQMVVKSGLNFFVVCEDPHSPSHL